MTSSNEKTTILYVEDNLDNRILVRRILMSENYAVLEAVNAFDALKILEKVTPDLILMDINMPDMDGYTLTARIKAMPGFERVLFWHLHPMSCPATRKEHWKPAAMATFKNRLI